MTSKNLKSNVFLNIVKSIFSIIFPLITYKYASSVLLPAGVGRYNYSVSVISFFQLIATLGITTYAITEGSKIRDNREKLNYFSSQMFNLGLLSMIFSYLLIAIFGLLGSICYFTYYYRATLQGLLRSPIVPAILFNLALGFMINGVDVMAHIGGLIGGILISMGIGIGDKGRKNDQVNGIIVLVLMFTFMLYMLFTK